MSSSYLQEERPNWSDTRCNFESEKFLSILVEGTAFGWIKHVSDSVGHEKLTLTFNELLEVDDRISYRFIDLSLKLDYFFNSFPKKEVLQLYKEMGKNAFALSLLRRFVWYNFYIYPRNHKLIESICKKIGIELYSPGEFANVLDNRVKRIE